MRSLPFGLPDRLLAPPPAERRVAFLRGRRFAHRGLHGDGVLENSRAAFNAAMAAGDGIECDVQLSGDGTAFVFHDATLERLTDQQGELATLPSGTIGHIFLRGTTEPIPRLEEMLAIVAGKVPLLIEVKAPNREIGRLCLSVRRALEGYRGPVAVMSFNPEVGRWFADHGPRITRGLVVTEENKRGARGRIERHLALWRARPDFLAYDVRDLPSRFASAQRARGLPVLTWTVRDQLAEMAAAEYADAPIYEVKEAEAPIDG
jgi:glycerophosphoryl diester phosphodiesterase